MPLRAGTASRIRTLTPEIDGTSADYDRLARIAQTDAGIFLGSGREEFLRTRIGRIVRDRGFSDLGAYNKALDGSGNTELRREFIDAITTNTSSFFREKPHYAWLEKHAETLLASAHRGAGLTVWSAACSTGQELYSALATLRAVLPKTTPLKGVGTDISTEVLQTAKRAIYVREEIDGIPDHYRHGMLLQSVKQTDIFRIVPDLRKAAEWRAINLIRSESYPSVAADVVFLRNVLIYFTPETQEQVLKLIVQRVRPGGLLFLGHSEAIQTKTLPLETLAPATYRRT